MHSPDPDAPLDRRHGSDPDELEWLLPDGRSGYGCGTASGLPTRRYHGLWVTRLAGEAKRHMVVAGLDERIGAQTAIAPNSAGSAADWPSAKLMPAHWHDVALPTRGHGETSFARRPLPTWTFATGFGTVERTVAFRRQEGEQTPVMLVRWRNRSEHAIRLQVRPLLGWCNVDHLKAARDDFDATVHARGASWGFRPTDELPQLWLTCDGVSAFQGEANWYRGFDYAIDKVRGYDHVGDRWSPGVLEVDLGPGQVTTAAFALEDPCDAPSDAFDAAEQVAVTEWQKANAAEHPLCARLALGAEDFLYRGVGDRVGVLAGFPWFGEWGRDVFLALPGLTLARGRVDQCVEVMNGCLPFLRDGLLPNIYGKDIATSNYGSCDAALWFALAAIRFADAGHDPDYVRDELVPAIRSIALAYERGTRLGLKLATDGLLEAGSEELNATWMDAQTSQGPVTPRDGLPVEIQAVWYALLSFLAEQETEEEEWFAGMRDRCGKSFVKQFWLRDVKSLADRVHDGVADAKVRPNMLVAAALSRSPLSNVQRQGVVKMAKAHLVTPCGMRTLSPEDEDYIGVYGGGLEGRDNAYHQGTVWPWPAGFFVEAALRAAPKKSRKKEAKELLAWLDEMLEGEMARAGLDHVNEVFDGDLPHRPGGTFAQAWNTGELLRAHKLCQQVLGGADMGEL